MVTKGESVTKKCRILRYLLELYIKIILNVINFSVHHHHFRNDTSHHSKTSFVVLLYSVFIEPK